MCVLSSYVNVLCEYVIFMYTWGLENTKVVAIVSNLLGLKLL